MEHKATHTATARKERPEASSSISANEVMLSSWPAAVHCQTHFEKSSWAGGRGPQMRRVAGCRLCVCVCVCVCVSVCWSVCVGRDSLISRESIWEARLFEGTPFARGCVFVCRCVGSNGSSFLSCCRFLVKQFHKYVCGVSVWVCGCVGVWCVRVCVCVWGLRVWGDQPPQGLSVFGEINGI